MFHYYFGKGSIQYQWRQNVYSILKFCKTFI